ncbi:TIGR04222 domain-containing membrane protein [Actinocorallia libanotica]|uniref:TIGR04222 domain-containing membrane protein n=1 Tax=Actinocorallia libanotica TaxID=46162 RepID=A0ABN1RAB9_9ACTN
MDSPPTWGITGPVFLAGFALAALLSTGFAVAVRNRVAKRLPVLPELHSYALAPLSARAAWENGVVAASLVFLRSRGLVAVADGGALRSVGDGEDLTGPLDRAVLQALAGGRRLGGVGGDRLVRSELARLRKEYRAWKDGLWRDHLARMRWSRLAVLPLVLLLPLGVVRLWAGAANGKPILFLLLLLLGLAAGIPVLLRWWVPGTPRPSWEERLREEWHATVQERLRESRSRPSRDEDGRGTAELVLRMAYFGTADLAAADPDFDAVIKGESERIAGRRKKREKRRAAERSAALGEEAEKVTVQKKKDKKAAARRDSRGSSFSSGSSYGGVYEGSSSSSSSSSSSGSGGGCGGGGGGGCGG